MIALKRQNHHYNNLSLVAKEHRSNPSVSCIPIERVKTRVSEGGHNIPEETLRRRYFKGIDNLKKFIPICDYWMVINNSSRPFTFIAEGQATTEIIIHNKLIWQKIKPQLDEKN